MTDQAGLSSVEGGPPPLPGSPITGNVTVVRPILSGDTVETRGSNERLESLWGPALNADADPGTTLRRRAGAGARAAHLLLRRHQILMSPPTGATPDYEVLEKLGEGGMGVVFKARQAALDRQIAIKLIKTTFAEDAENRSRFLAEAVVTGDLDHPNIVPIHDVGISEGGQLFYTMKRVHGTAWSAAIGEKTIDENLRILLDVADAVAFAHSRGVIHRDLKPANVMLGEFGEVLVMDWGLAASVGETNGKADPLTEASTFGGTPAYMAPEMAAGDAAAIGPHSDVYLLGGILYEIVTGRPPHAGRTARECLENAALNHVEPPPKDRGGELFEIARKALATAPEGRYASVRELQQAIHDWRTHAESHLLCEKGRLALERARWSRQHQDFNYARYAFIDAGQLWPENPAALAGRGAALEAFADFACAGGDYEEAAALVREAGLEQSELARRIAAGIAARDRRFRQARRLRWTAGALGALLALVLVVAAGWIWSSRMDLIEERARLIEEKNRETLLRQQIQAARLADMYERKKLQRALTELRAGQADPAQAESTAAPISPSGAALPDLEKTALEDAGQTVHKKSAAKGGGETPKPAAPIKKSSTSRRK